MSGVDEFEIDDAEYRQETESVGLSFDETMWLLKNDFEFFIQFFLGSVLDMEIPEFHKEIWGLLIDQTKPRHLLAIPRDHAKTTLAKLVVIWYWLFSPHRFCVYLSNTNPIAMGACKDIMNFLATPNFVEVFGKINMVKSNENESLWVFDLTIGKVVKRCILRAAGQGQQVRGINLDNQRPDIAVIDDVEDLENTGNEDRQKALDKWMFGPFLKALSRKKKILWLGNMLSKTSLLARLSKDPRWNPVVFGSLYWDTRTGKMESLWPEKFSLADLIDDFKEYQRLGLVESWMCEMMNMPGHNKNGFTADQINYVPCPQPDEIHAAFITVDPAFGKKQQNDETSIAVHVIPKDPDMPPTTVEVVHGRMSEVEMFETVLFLARKWNAWSWGIESVAAQKVLITLFEMLLAQKRINHAPIIVPLMSGIDAKVTRINSWVSQLASKLWAITEDDVDITGQLLQYDPTGKKEHDDIIDSAAYGPIMLKLYEHMIRAKAMGSLGEEQDKPKYGMEVANV